MTHSAAPPQWPDSYSIAEREALLNWARQPNHYLIPLDDPRYPPLLREIPDPPPLLFVRGNVDVLSRPQVAIVGSRSPTPDGRNNARLFAAGLSAAGYVITSGLALGIDGEAHRGTLDCGGVTIAVLGSGLDNISPPTHCKLAAQVEERGALVSEFAPTEEGLTWHFPQRNRIISGLAHGVLVVEAAQRSGSLITARYAGEQGREIFAVPGSIHNPCARGCHRLIRQGAKLVESVADVIEELGALVQWERESGAITQPGRKELPADLRKVLKCIGYDPVPIDTLLQRAGGKLPDLLARLMQLEIGGHVEHRADGYVLSRS